jgi:fibronectin type 3 domain-containing protein
VKGYNVFRNGTLLSQVTTTSFSDSAVSISATYTYGVSAVDVAGNFSTTTTISVTVPLCPDSTPPNVPAAPSVSALICSQVNVSWSAVTDRSNPTQQVSGLKGYNVYRQNSFLAFVTNTSMSDSVPGGNMTYSYQISAVDKSDNESARGPAGTITVPSCPDLTPPNVPAGLAVVALDCARANLSWLAASDGVVANQASSGVKGYNIYRGGAFLTFVSTTNAIDTGLLGNTPYSYQVSAVDYVNNESALSQAVVLTIPGCPDTTPPSVPSNLAVSSLKCNQFTFSWSPSSDQSGPNQILSGLIGYNVYRDDVFLQFTTSPVVIDSTVAEGSFYRYRVSAVDAAYNSSALSTSFDVTIPSCAASSATNLRIVISNRKVGLQWSGSAGALYQVESTIAFGTPWTPVDGPTASFASTNHLCDPANMFRVALFTNTAAYLANYSVNSMDITPPPIPAPLVVTASPGAQVALSWAPVEDVGTFDPAQGRTFTAGLARYLIYRDGTYLKSEPANVTNSADFSISPGEQYTYSVAAIDKAGNVSQKATDTVNTCIFLEPSAAITGPEATNGSFVVDAINCSWSASVSGESSWIQLQGATSGTGTADINYSVASNPELTDRVGTVLVQNKTYTLTQKGRQCSYSLSPLSMNHGSAGGLGSFSINAPSGCSWTATTGDSWVHTSTSGSGGGTVSYIVDSNSGSLRSGSISVGGRTFTVTQDGAACNYVLNPTSTSSGSASFLGSFTVASPAGCGWSPTVTNSWVHATSVTGGVNYSVDANTTSGARSGTIDVAGQLFSITQAGAAPGCTYALSSSVAGFVAAGGSSNVTVTTSNGCSWNVSNSPAWLTITSGSTGVGSASVNYVVTANASPSSRSATLIIAGKNFTVTQNGNQAPTANAGLDVSVSIGATTSFSASGSSDPDGSISSYNWAFGDGFTASGFSVSHTYSTLGVYTVTLSVTDNLGATATDSLLATVLALPDITPPTVSLSVSGSSNVSGVVNFVATASDNVGVTKTEFYRDGALFTNITFSPYSTSFDTRTLPNGNHTFLARAYDAANNANSSSATVLVDNTAPVVSLTQPINGSTVSNTITLAANASDNVGGSGLARVDFYCDNALVPLGTSTTAPYSFPCDTTTMVNGNHVLYSKAYDVAGNVGVSTSNQVTVLNAVSPGQCQLQRNFGGVGPSSGAITKCNALDRSGNLVVVGSMYYNVDFGTGVLSSTGGQDAFVAKYSASGQCLWARHLGNVSSDLANGVAVDSSGNILVLGSVSGSPNPGMLDFGTGLVQCYGGSDILLVKYSPAGSVLWSKVFGGTGSDVGTSIAVDSNDNILLTGTHAFFGTGVDFGGGVLPTYGQQDVFIAKLNSSGNYIWATSYGGSDSDMVTSLAVDPAGNVIIGGHFRSTANFGSGNVTSAGDTDAFIGKYSGTNGSNLWFKKLGNSASQIASGVAVDSAGNAIIAGDFTGTIDFGGTLAVAEAGGSFYVAKYNSSGVYQWSKSFGAPDNGPHSAGVAVDNLGRIIVVGEITTGIDFGTGWLLGQGGNDAFILKLESNSSLSWVKRGSPYGDRSTAVCVDKATNAIFLSGDSGTAGFDFGSQTILSTSGTSNNASFFRFSP